MNNMLKRTRTPLDTNIIFLHRLLLVIMLILFAYCKYTQLERQIPSCSGSGVINVEEARKTRLCISTVAYVEYKGERKYSNVFGLYLPPTLFILALLYVIPIKYQSFLENKNLVGLFEEAQRLPRLVAIRNIEVVIMYNHGLRNARMRLSWECLEVNLCCLLILDMISSTNLLTKIILGGITEGWKYVTHIWSMAFPINVKCEIGPQMVYSASNTMYYRCIIPHNEIFKPIWMVAVIMVLIGLFLSLISFMYHMVQMLPFRQRQFFQGIVEMDDFTLNTLLTQLPGDDNLLLLKSYLVRLPSKDQRKDVVEELNKIIKDIPI